MDSLSYYLIACVVAFCVNYYRVYSSDRFHNFFFLIMKRWVLIFYCMIYAAIAGMLLFLLKDNVIRIVKNNTIIDKYLLPISIGLLTKGVADINLFNVKMEGFSLPIGLRTITQPLDKFFEEKFDSVSFKKLKAYMSPYLQKYRQVLIVDYQNDINKLKDNRLTEIRNYYADKEKIVNFESGKEYKNIKTPEDLLGAVLREFGKMVFEEIFQLP